MDLLKQLPREQNARAAEGAPRTPAEMGEVKRALAQPAGGAAAAPATWRIKTTERDRAAGLCWDTSSVEHSAAARVVTPLCHPLPGRTDSGMPPS